MAQQDSMSRFRVPAKNFLSPSLSALSLIPPEKNEYGELL